MLWLKPPVTIGLTDRFKVTILSHPERLTKVSLYAPAEVKLIPLNKKEAPLQMLWLKLPITIGFTDRVNVTILSHPETLTRVSLYAPAEVKFIPLNKKEAPLQMLWLKLPITTGFTDRFKVTILSHPETLTRVSLYAPAFVKFIPLNK